MKFACGWKRLRNWISPAAGRDGIVFCVCGMHRSGTSMVSQVLSRMGVYMGPDEVLRVSADDNRDGFWEDDAFVCLNDEILRHLAGAWDAPPAFERGWERASVPRPITRRAKKLIRKRTGFAAWGWKDPRTSLVLPFWQSLIPGLKVIVCLRHPWEVARSLNRRNQMPIAAGLELWRAYQASVLAATHSRERIITHYDSHFADPAAEIARIADFLGVAQSPALLEELSATCKGNLRHNRLDNDSPDAALPRPVGDLYLELCEEAGPVFRGQKSEPLVLTGRVHGL